jgi:outer membrane protein OmpA-like peptidoglycan-associated protein
MKTGRRPTQVAALRAKKLAVTLSAAGLVCLPVAAQDTTQGSASDNGAALRGKMLDRSRTLVEAVAPNTETQSSQLDALSPSALTDGQQRIMLDTAAPQGPAQGELKMMDDGGDSYFASGLAELTPRSVAMLSALAASLQGKRDIHIEVIGHTDSQRIVRSPYSTNQALSQGRALAVAAFLRQRLQLPAGGNRKRWPATTAPRVGHAIVVSRCACGTAKSR